jgi:hypothetical protein
MSEWAIRKYNILEEALDTRQAVYDRLLKDYMELKNAKTP